MAKDDRPCCTTRDTRGQEIDAALRLPEMCSDSTVRTTGIEDVGLGTSIWPSARAFPWPWTSGRQAKSHRCTSSCMMVLVDQSMRTFGRLGHRVDVSLAGVMQEHGCCLQVASVDWRVVVADRMVEPDDGVLVRWSRTARRRARSVRAHGRGGLRFAFYGRTSTVEFQDPVSSLAWQREAAECAIAGRGRIVAEFLDVGHSRRRPWRDRPQARALLEAVRAPDRGFDAIVVGEYERAFAGDEFERLAPLFERYGSRFGCRRRTVR
jgi:hypothetical protein